MSDSWGAPLLTKFFFESGIKKYIGLAPAPARNPGSTTDEKTYAAEQECIPVGCVPSAAVAVLKGSVSGQGEGCVCLPRGMYTSSTVNRITDSCKNITFPQLRLRTVVILFLCANK